MQSGPILKRMQHIRFECDMKFKKFEEFFSNLRKLKKHIFFKTYHILSLINRSKTKKKFKYFKKKSIGSSIIYILSTHSGIFEGYLKSISLKVISKIFARKTCE